MMDQEAELLYKIVQWNESLLQSAGKTPAGPLFSIQCGEDAVSELHLPHCETKTGEQISIWKITSNMIGVGVTKYYFYIMQ